MTTTFESPAAALLRMWDRTRALPFGHRLFSRLVGRRAPYTGTIGATILALEAGYARAILRDRRAVRNHLASIHAVALANLGELTTGLAVSTALPPTVRGIPVRLAVAYQKKARGTITAECRCPAIPPLTASVDQVVTARLIDAAGESVAEVEAVWRLGPV